MDDEELQQRTEHLAHQIWEAEGRPEGQQHRHWAMAQRLLQAEPGSEGEDVDGQP